MMHHHQFILILGTAEGVDAECCSQIVVGVDHGVEGEHVETLAQRLVPMQAALAQAFAQWALGARRQQKGRGRVEIAVDAAAVETIFVQWHLVVAQHVGAVRCLRAIAQALARAFSHLTHAGPAHQTAVVAEDVVLGRHVQTRFVLVEIYGARVVVAARGVVHFRVDVAQHCLLPHAKHNHGHQDQYEKHEDYHACCNFSRRKFGAVCFDVVICRMDINLRRGSGARGWKS